MKYKDEIETSISTTLKERRDGAIKNILNIIDISNMSDYHKKQIRKVVMEELNGYYLLVGRILNYIQE